MGRNFPTIVLTGLMMIVSVAVAEDPDPSDDKRSLAEKRLEVMATTMTAVRIRSADPEVPKQLHANSLFRYDDETRGYVDGTVWKLGETGRPLAMITSELHPNYGNLGPRMVFDFLSLTDKPFAVVSDNVPGWSPSASAVEMKQLTGAPPPAASPAKRLTQLKEQSRRFSGTQDVEELLTTLVDLRLMPREIDRYSPAIDERADGAIFLFANGRNPAVVLLIETDGKEWQYGLGRLTLPSILKMRLDDEVVWSQPRNPSYSMSTPYAATNVAAKFP
jgi:hypothetical protein